MDQPEPGEFDFLAGDAAAVGAADVPVVRRIQLTGAVSALAWGTDPAGVVLAHGAALNAHTWDSTLLAWTAAVNGGDRYLGSPATGFLALDLPGHGDSAWREDGDYAPGRIAPDVAGALAAAVGSGVLADRFALVGQSLGGLVGLELIQAGRAAFDHLVLVDVLPLKPEAAGLVASFLDGPTSFASREEIVERARAFGLGGASVERGVFLNTRRGDDGRIVWKHHLGALGPRALEHLETRHLWDAVANASVPIDLVAATVSLVDDESWLRFAELRPGATAVRLDGSHNLQEDNPVQLAMTLRSLLG